MSSNETWLSEIESPHEYFAEHADEMTAIGARAFGRTPEDFREDMEDHFRAATHGQVIEQAGHAVGFALYEDLGDMLWLQGVAVGRECQGLGMGTFAVKEAFRGFNSLVATTRNPATVKLVGKITGLACPDLRLADPIANLSDVNIKDLFERFG